MSKDFYPQFPLYIPTKGRHQYMMTSRYLTRMGVHHYLVVEPQQLADYHDAVERMKINATILELDMTFKERYELCDSLGLSKSTGPGPARNFAWAHSMSNGFKWHWVMDDNIREFNRLSKNTIIRALTPAFWRAMEDFALRYKNVAMAGPNYTMFAPVRVKHPPFVLNTRIYSCNLIRNDIPFRWRGRYNEDTILSLDMLKAGWCTIQFNAFLQRKLPTQRMKGGNTDEFYHAVGTIMPGTHYSDKGTIAKSKMLADVHPDVAKVVFKFNRWHHEVDYSGFKKMKLIRRDDIQIPKGVNEYGMRLKKIE